MASLGIIFAGAGGFGIPTLKGLVQSSHRVVLVVTQPDRPAGRGRGLSPTPIAEAAEGLNLPVLKTDNINAETLPPADVMVVIAFGQKISPQQVDHPRLGSINLHASRLPLYRGAAPIHSAILAGDDVTGNSVIRLAPRMDAGAILAQSTVPIGPLETTGELHGRLAQDGVGLVQRVLVLLENGTAIEIPQEDARATMAPKLSRESARLDFTQPAEVLARRIRGLYPWPGCRVALCDALGQEVARIRLIQAAPNPEDEQRWEPGEITSVGSVQTGLGTLNLVEIQPDGGKPMSLDAYKRGHRWQAGLRLRSPE